MTAEELRNEYPDGEVFPNQFELGKFVQEYGVRKKITAITSKWPGKVKDTEEYYDIAELCLSKGVAFFNDDNYIIEDLLDLETDL